MPGVCRAYDMAAGTGSHGSDCCPHAITGHYIQGAVTVRTNGRPTQRVFDILAITCPHGHMGMSIRGSATVNAEGKGVTRQGDTVSWFCGVGVNVTSSANVKAGG